MKKLVLFVSLAFSFSASANSIESHLNNIRDRVRQCSVIPYYLKDNKKVYESAYSHCPEVKVVSDQKGHAKIKVSGHIYFAFIKPSKDSDADLYDLMIRDYATNETLIMKNILSFGDVLIAVLGGDLKGVAEQYIGFR